MYCSDYSRADKSRKIAASNALEASIVRNKTATNRLMIVMFGGTLTVAGALAFLMDLVGFGKLAFDVIINKETTQLFERILVLTVIFGVAIGVTLLGVQAVKWGNPMLILRIYTYLYAFLVAITYASIVFVSSFR